MNVQIIQTLIVKELLQLIRNPILGPMILFSLVGYLAVFFFMPATLEEKFTLGLYAPDAPAFVFNEFKDKEIKIQTFDSKETLRKAVAKGDYRAGVVLLPENMQKLETGQKTKIDVYFPADTPRELDHAFAVLLTMMFAELGDRISGKSFNIDLTEEILGPDMTGKQIAHRDRLLPLFAVLILLMETLALAGLIAEEYGQQTLQALMVTPMNLRHLLIGKGITGAGLAFLQAAVMMAVTGGLSGHPLLILTALLLGALMVTGIGFLLGSTARDLMGVMGWGVFVVILLSVPAMSVMFPGTISGWIKLIPSFFLVDTVHQVANFDAGWGDVWQNMLMLLLSGGLALWLGAVILGRKLR